jgi:hypothetical protein
VRQSTNQTRQFKIHSYKQTASITCIYVVNHANSRSYSTNDVNSAVVNVALIEQQNSFNLSTAKDGVFGGAQTLPSTMLHT